MSVLLAILGSSGFGVLIGGLFAWLNRKTDLEGRRLDLAHERDKWAHERGLRADDLAMVRAEAEGRREVAVVEGEATVEAARMAALAAAYASDTLGGDELNAAGWWRWLLVVVDAFRRFIRPGATVVLLGGALYMQWVVLDRWVHSDWAGLTLAQRYEAGMAALNWVAGQTSACLSYWFVSRGNSR